jgi:TIR domain
MATLRELFDGEFGHMLKIQQVASFSNPTSEAIERLYYGFSEYACFLAYYVAEEFATPEFLHNLIAQYQNSISRLKGILTAITNQTGTYEASELSSDGLPFTGRIIMYVDRVLEHATRLNIFAFGAAQGVRIQIRDKSYGEFITAAETPLGFICHDSRDKDSFVRPLAERLRSVLCPIWYDEFSLRPGDSLRGSIDAGLRVSKRCVVVLSQNFFTNPGWGETEFNAIMNKHISAGGDVLIPIWLDVTQKQVADYSPLVVDIVAITSDMGLDEMFHQLHKRLLADSECTALPHIGNAARLPDP